MVLYLLVEYFGGKLSVIILRGYAEIFIYGVDAFDVVIGLLFKLAYSGLFWDLLCFDVGGLSEVIYLSNFRHLFEVILLLIIQIQINFLLTSL